MKNFNLMIRPISVLMGITVLFTNVGCSKHEHKEIRAEYSIAKPWRKDLIVKKKFVAQVSAMQHIELRAFEKGYLQKISVDEGQLIKKDQEMFQIMPLITQAEYSKAKAEYDLARIEYKNTKNLMQKKVVSDNELALAKAKLDKAKAELQLNKTHLDLTTIKAPFDGIMDRFRVRLGSLVEEGELLTTLSDNSKIWVYFNVSEADYLDYMEEKRNDEKVEVDFELANGKLFKNKGVIDAIEADFNRETGNVAFRATFSNEDRLIRHGSTGNIILSEKLENALVIPQKATFEVLDKKFVYVVSDSNEVQSRQITVSQEVPHLFVVSSGLKESDRVLIEGLGKVKAGDHIEAKIKESSAVLASLDLPVN
jgi:membrane fusion protein (multidrug efflux system)